MPNRVRKRTPNQAPQRAHTDLSSFHPTSHPKFSNKFVCVAPPSFECITTCSQLPKFAAYGGRSPTPIPFSAPRVTPNPKCFGLTSNFLLLGVRLRVGRRDIDDRQNDDNGMRCYHHPQGNFSSVHENTSKSRFSTSTHLQHFNHFPSKPRSGAPGSFNILENFFFPSGPPFGASPSLLAAPFMLQTSTSLGLQASKPAERHRS